MPIETEQANRVYISKTTASQRSKQNDNLAVCVNYIFTNFFALQLNFGLDFCRIRGVKGVRGGAHACKGLLGFMPRLVNTVKICLVEN